MSAGDFLVTAVCGGGGNDIAAYVLAFLVIGAFVAGMIFALSRAEDGDELALLILLTGVTIAVGGILFLYPNGIGGGGDFLGRFVLSLVISGGLGVGATVKLGEGSAARAIFLALAGDVVIPGGIFVLFIASMLWGTGCLE